MHPLALIAKSLKTFEGSQKSIHHDPEYMVVFVLTNPAVGTLPKAYYMVLKAESLSRCP